MSVMSRPNSTISSISSGSSGTSSAGSSSEGYRSGESSGDDVWTGLQEHINRLGASAVKDVRRQVAALLSNFPAASSETGAKVCSFSSLTH